MANVNKEAHKTMMDDEAIKIALKNDAADRVNDQELKNLKPSSSTISVC